MNAGSIVALLAPLAPALARGVPDGSAGYALAARVWSRLADAVAGTPSGLLAWRQLVENPGDDAALLAFQVELALLLGRNPQLQRDLDALWPRARDEAPGRDAMTPAPPPPAAHTHKDFDAPIPPVGPPAQARIRRLQTWLDPADPERPWLVSLVVGVGFRTPAGGLDAAFDESVIFGPSDEVVTLDVVAASTDFTIESGPQLLRLSRVGPSRNVAHIDLAIDGGGVEAREGAVTVHLFKEGNFAAGVVVRLRVGPGDLAIVSVEEIGRSLTSLGVLRPRQLSLVIQRSGDAYSIIAFGALRAELTLPITRQEMERMRVDARSALAELVGHRFTGGKVYQDGISIPSDVAATSLGWLARTGFRLFRALFYDRGDPTEMQFGDWLRSLADRATLKIQVVSDDVFLPWGLLYLAESYTPETADPRFFLGFRHVIEHVLIRTPAETPDVELLTSPQITVGLNLNLSIDAQVAASVVADQLAGWDAVTTGTAATPNAVRVNQRSTADAVRRALDDPATADDIWYFYCHAAAGSLDDPGGADASYLELTGGSRIRLSDLKNGSYRALLRHPLIVLNACNSATMSPLFYGGFLPYFLRRGARGVVGTECDIPAIFAAAWAERFFRRFLSGDRPLGSVLLDLRAEFLDRHRNPLGLLYALYCDADTVAVPGSTWEGGNR